MNYFTFIHAYPCVHGFLRWVAGLLVFMCLIPAWGIAGENEFPFHPGEKLVFELKWTVVPAGEATLEVLPVTKVKGKDAFHFVLTAKTNKALDKIYKVRDRIDGYTDVQMTHSIFYSKKQREGSFKKNVLVKFFWDSHEAVYTDLLKKKKRRPVALLAGAFDPISIFYFARSLPLDVGMVLERPVTDGKKCVVGKASILKRETIEVSAGTFDTFLMEPELKHIGGVFKKSENAKIELWVTADEKKIPVKLQSNVVVGSFTAELVSYK